MLSIMCNIYQGIIKLWESLVCSKDEYDEWHKHNCLFGSCPYYGVEILSFYPKKLTRSHSNVIQWCQFSLETTTMARNGQTLKKLTLMYKSTTIDKFINYLKPKLQHFVKHNFIAHWEDKYFK
jgi:hypothetical protein